MISQSQRQLDEVRTMKTNKQLKAVGLREKSTGRRLTKPTTFFQIAMNQDAIEELVGAETSMMAQQQP